MPSPVDVATSIAWALLRAKVDHLQSPSSGVARIADRTLSDELSTLLSLSTGKGAIPASVLAKAPHLAKLSAPVMSDPHLEKTQELVSVFSPQNIQDILVNKAQFAPVRDPLPQTFWRKILLDSYVDFEKLFASMDVTLVGVAVEAAFKAPSLREVPQINSSLTVGSDSSRSRIFGFNFLKALSSLRLGVIGCTIEDHLLQPRYLATSIFKDRSVRKLRKFVLRSLDNRSGK